MAERQFGRCMKKGLWLAKAQATAQVDVTAPQQCCVFLDSLMSALFLSLRRRSHHIGMKSDVIVDPGL